MACIVLFIHTYWGFDGPSQFAISLLLLLLGAAIIGFLPFNLHPNKVIIGDTGAMSLGSFLGVLAIIGGAKIGMMLRVLGAPILEGIWLIINRLMYDTSAIAHDVRYLYRQMLRARLNCGYNLWRSRHIRSCRPASAE